MGKVNVGGLPTFIYCCIRSGNKSFSGIAQKGSPNAYTTTTFGLNAVWQRELRSQAVKR